MDEDVVALVVFPFAVRSVPTVQTMPSPIPWFPYADMQGILIGEEDQIGFGEGKRVDKGCAAGGVPPIDGGPGSWDQAAWEVASKLEKSPNHREPSPQSLGPKGVPRST